MKATLRAVLLFCTLSSPALAEISAEQREDMAATLQAAQDAALAGNVEPYLTTIPTVVLDKMAAEVGMSREQALEKMRAQAKIVLASPQDLPRPKLLLDRAEYATTAGGRDYAVYITDSQYEISGVKCHVRMPSVVFVEDGHWVQFPLVSPETVDLLKQAYPDFADVTFATMTTEPI